MTEILTLEAPELRFAGDAATGEFEGYAATWDVVPRFNERMMPGAFKRTLAAWAAKGRLPPGFWNHNSDEPIILYSHMAEDQRGLKVTGKIITSIPRAASAMELHKNGVPLGFSISFRSISDRSVKGIREITEADLLEVSLTANPASDNARITKFRNAAQPARLAAFIEEVRRASAALR